MLIVAYPKAKVEQISSRPRKGVPWPVRALIERPGSFEVTLNGKEIFSKLTKYEPRSPALLKRLDLVLRKIAMHFSRQRMH